MSSRIQDALPVASVGSSAPAHAALGIASGWDWDELSGPYRTRLVAAGVARFGLRPEECEDALQGVFVKILLQAPRVRDPKAYLKTAFLNQCRELIDARQRARPQEATFDEATARGHDPRGRVEQVIAVNGAYRRIGTRCREAIRSYCVEKETLEETARRCGFSSKTIWKRLQECFKRMRTCLEA
ncbi:MAG TPA: sigma-70 family RNA polymerase sigma factor [Thermoanaerobaculia bacterium]|jgi:RNA polymerase sigma factor (sigma-70 family)|nr:sigma-70 family RNA polymerase sigma factor [Thermoanaerobaculia bacterium]